MAARPAPWRVAIGALSLARLSRTSSLSIIERVPLRIGAPLALAATLAMCLAALLVRWWAHPVLPPGYPFLTFFPAVIGVSFLLGARMGTLAGVICGLLAWYFFIPPFHSFGFRDGAGFAMGFYALVVVTDIVLVHWMQTANARLARERELSAALARTREMLFKELQHRVSNNLQVVAGLISVQKRGISDEQARAALDEAARRTALIGKISRQLYDASGGKRQMREFLEPLCEDVIQASGHQGVRCHIDIAADATVSPDSAVPLALIVAEAMANAIEHGFAGGKDGTIEVRLTSGEDSVHVEIRDDGHGLPEGFDIEATGSLGLRIARTLAAGMKGSFEMVSDGGTVARLVLPADAD